MESADWIRERLHGWEHADAGSVVPGGFESYVRLLHPADRDLAPVRWSEVAAWSGLPRHRLAMFHSVALPLDPRPAPVPFDGSPEVGTLERADAEALVEVLGRHTTTPADAWFCVWAGWGWDARTMLTAVPQPPPAPPRGRRRRRRRPGARLPDPVPAGVRSGPQVRLPNRDYLLYEGPVDAALADVGGSGQTPQLWWPADRAWCVASEIDLPWTYVGGSAALAGELLGHGRLEALPAEPGDPVARFEPWLEERAGKAADQLRRTGEVVVETGVGVYRARLTRRWRVTWYHDWADRGRGRSAHGSTRLRRRPAEGEPDELVRTVAYGLIGLVG